MWQKIVISMALVAIVLSTEDRTEAQQIQACDAICSKQQQVDKFKSNDQKPFLDADLKRINSQRLHDALVELHLLIEQNLSVAKDLLSDAPEADKTELGDKINALQQKLQAVEHDLSLPGPSSQASSPPATVITPSATVPTTAGTNNDSIPASSAAGPLMGATRFASCSAGSSSANTYLSMLARGAAELIVSRQDPSAANDQIDRILFAGFSDVAVPQQFRGNFTEVMQKLYVKSETRKATDKQIGASPQAEGSTSAIERPDFTKLLGFAVEHGAVEQVVNGTTLTLSSSPYALMTAGKGGDTAENYSHYNTFTRLGASATFNIQDQNNVLTSATRKQLSEWSVRYRFNPDRSTRSKDFLDYWNSNVLPELNNSGVALGNALLHLQDENSTVINAIDQKLTAPDGFIAQYYNQHKNEPQDTLTDGLEKEISCRVEQQFTENMNSLQITDATRVVLQQDLDAYAKAQEGLQTAITQAENFSKELEKRWQGTFAYTQKQQQITSNYSILKFIFEKSAPAPLKLTANIEGSLYHRPDPFKNQETLRDFSAALSFEYLVGRSPFVTNPLDQSQVSLSFTGSYERMPENRGVLNKKADIGNAQFKFQLPVASGIVFPISFTFANSSELVNKNHWRANFGLTFDLDKLSQLMSVSSQP